MSEAEMAEYQRRYKARWQRWQVELNWSKGPMATWKPVFTEQEKREHDEYVKLHQCPF